MSALAKALVAAQAEFPPIERSKDVRVQTKTGGSYSFSYAPLDAILNSVRPVLTKHGLAVSQLLGHIDRQPALKTVLLHEDGESLEDVCPLPANGSMSAQEFGSLVTYFRRYALVTVLGIATEEDDDGNAASGNSSVAVSSPGGDPTATENPAEAARRAQQAAGATHFSEARPYMTEEQYLALHRNAMAAGAVPSQQIVSFGKNKGVLLSELTTNQLRWYAEDWQPQDDPSPYDLRLKAAAVALFRGDDTSEALKVPDSEIPF